MELKPVGVNELDLAYQEICRSALNAEQTRSLAETDHWKHVDRGQVHADWDALYKRISPLIGSASPADAAVQALLHEHYQIACRFYTPSKLAYIGMALFYDENPAMKEFHNAYHPQMVAFLGAAMLVYAEQKLSASA
ncbi:MULTISPECIES: TipAS antibiotic-recognition domain-containing protein [unclassified Janthinobacterium]|uniref:TipAS antibiotic-recognition domain-containing protein n=1 Tax=unclassified Janthinobacterium TaxID=2610881 RepID=UPI00034D7A30|nr:MULTISPECIES: TipAS antibiotic-recognition domain-containing protein [unclassified Janthinobacterium]MEC5160862.1 hypothetical protein [Janthinobacterium sp. CG_S6]